MNIQSPRKKDEKLEDDAQIEKSISSDSSFVKKKKGYYADIAFREREKKVSRVNSTQRKKTTHGGKPERQTAQVERRK